MDHRVDLDHTHSRAIVREIGERLGESLQPEPGLPEGLRQQIDRLRELDEQSPSIIPTTERWDRFAASANDGSAELDEQCHR
ncbi:hypothetical protein [Bradyrhizobium sp. th.b2]|uniref:hypothetical protein n=1 Tax=Bradyrhizobium sp. th-b2 TaxID=172088 RepID=UPI000565BA7D|nr:hypothetical protein [Bradyrhizobium sp. th.b2]